MKQAANALLIAATLAMATITIYPPSLSDYHSLRTRFVYFVTAFIVYTAFYTIPITSVYIIRNIIHNCRLEHLSIENALADTQPLDRK